MSFSPGFDCSPGFFFTMPCYHPIQAWRSRQGRNSNGSWPLVFNRDDGYPDMEVIVPCGRCIGCRLDKSRDWAVRCMHESSLWDSNLFLTLTYDDAHLPIDNGLDKTHFQKFMKRLRKWVFDPNGLGRVPQYEYFEDDQKHLINGVRFFHCGEYGGKRGRPHYHAIIYNLDFPDKVPYKLAPSGDQLYVSQTLNDLWGFGYCIIGGVTFESCAYVARYIMKKQTGELSFLHYLDPVTGVIRQKEYITMSRAPGIGGQWFERYHDDVFPRGYVLSNGYPAQPPRYYVNLLDKKNHQDYLTYKNKRANIANRYKGAPDNHPDRLFTREQLASIRADQLVRPLDDQVIQQLSSYVDIAENFEKD
uniref:Replication initiator protein n=2 Tax=Dulem virus 149 TaxID=3145626 RepID=A0AAU8AXM0_9VIRU